MFKNSSQSLSQLRRAEADWSFWFSESSSEQLSVAFNDYCLGAVPNASQHILFSLFCMNNEKKKDQVIIAQWLAWQIATGEVPGSNPGKGENLLISD